MPGRAASWEREGAFQRRRYLCGCRGPSAGLVWVSQAIGEISLGVAAGMRWRQAEERGEATSMCVVGRRRDLCGCRRPSAGSLLVSWQGCVDGWRRRGGKIPVFVLWAAGRTYVDVASRRRDLSWTLGVATRTRRRRAEEEGLEFGGCSGAT